MYDTKNFILHEILQYYNYGIINVCKTIKLLNNELSV